MSAEFTIVTATADHVASVAARMRKADRDEVEALGLDAGEALVKSVSDAPHSWAVLIDGKPEMIFGVGDLNILAGVGAPWALGTDAIEKHFLGFLRRSVDFRDQLLSRYPILRNVVDSRNTVSIRWLQWLGFRLLDRVEFGGHEFRVFELRASDVH